MLECRLYAKTLLGKDKFIGETKDAVKLLLAEGGLYDSMLLAPSANDLHS